MNGRMTRGQAGQMTVELAVAMPVMIAIAVIVVNAILFMGECAAFDRLAKDAIRVHAASPGYGMDAQACAARVQETLALSFDKDFEQVRVEVRDVAGGHLCYEATLSFAPTLFGRSFSGVVFGVALPPVQHRAQLVVSPFKPGVVV